MGRLTRKWKVAAVVCGVLAAINAACGGTSIATGPGNPAGCTVTLSGGVSGEYNCTVGAALAYNHANGTIGFGLSVNPTTNGQPPSTVVGVAIPGAGWSTGTYAQTISGATGGVEVQSALEFWQATVGGTADQGSWSLHLSNAGTAVTNGSGDKVYTGSHGTFDATAPAIAVSGATGTVTVHAAW
jgi:hypothetical protein